MGKETARGADANLSEDLEDRQGFDFLRITASHCMWGVGLLEGSFIIFLPSWFCELSDASWVSEKISHSFGCL